MPAPLPVVLSAYDPRWPQLAAAHAERLKTLGPLVEAIHHIGSTSVPGLTAKW
ncbi:GrpB protein [Methylosinus sp. sav-2]|nr:GrpB protein [Methylosinus sp. sav-2]